MHTTIADMLVTQLGALADQLAHVLPWVKSLNEDERADLLADLAQACAQVRHTGQSQALLELQATHRSPTVLYYSTGLHTLGGHTCQYTR
jgi:hypothetical protein